MQPVANMTTQNLINLYQTLLRFAGMRTKIFLLMLIQNFPYFIKKVTGCVRCHVPLRKLSEKQLSLQSKLWISVRIKKYDC